MSVVDYGSDDDDDDDNGDGDNEDVVDALQTETVLNEALEDAEENCQPKIEEIEDDSGLRAPLEQGGGEPGANTNIENRQAEEHSQVNAQTTLKSGLKDMSRDPILAAHSSSSQNQSISVNMSLQKSAIYEVVRERIAYSEPDDLFLDLDLIEGLSKLSTDEATAIPSDAFNLSSTDLTAIFPDVQPLGLLDVAPSPFEGGSKKKGEKRSDRDDPNKRTEDITYTKLAPVSRFMYIKPTLLGALQPAKKWINGAWVDFEREAPIAVDYETPLRVPEEPSNGKRRYQ
jgi:chromatin modification-related protein VID21